MSRSIYPNYPPEFVSQHQEQYALESLKDKACSIGFLVKPLPTGSGELPEGAIPAPITIFPSVFPKSCFEFAQQIQKEYNVLYARIAMDEGWLEPIASRLAEIDDFVHRLWQIHVDIRKIGYKQVSSY